MLFARRMRRPFHWGPYPLERLPRAPSALTPAMPAAPTGWASGESSGGLAAVAERYADIFAEQRDGPVAAARAPVPEDLESRVADVKGAAYFLDASVVGVAPLGDGPADPDPEPDADMDTHRFAVVLLVEHGRLPEPDNAALEWVAPAASAIARMRAAEIAVCVAAHIRTMGFSARAHWAGNSEIEITRLVHRAGLAVFRDGELRNPWFGDCFEAAVISTDYELPIDEPLATTAMGRAQSLGYWLGVSGATSGRERQRRLGRKSHLSRYPMEQVRRVERPTTLILDDEVPQVPHRAAFFHRAGAGDLGQKAQREVARFAYKQPLSYAMRRTITSLVPYQDGPVAEQMADGLSDPRANTRAVKSLAYHLGADLVGICEVPRYAWYSHDRAGNAVSTLHRHAVVMLIDQGFETMEGASGDDWISGAQSMRGYLRGAEIAGVMAEHVRSLGFAARAHTNAESQVLHIPLVLLAGLGELSRIGELVLNPFVGPRFKSVVFTTDLPLENDQPIDFGLQDFCGNCRKCARECPCDAIPLGDKVMFNGYEIWKPDVERCTRYRVTNPGGAACGRCMKTCPLNKVVDADGPLYARVASWLGVNAMWLKPLLVPIATRLDDWLGHGRRVPAKKWWLDLEVIDGICVAPAKTNQRDIDPSRSVDPSRQKIAYFPASVMPRSNDSVHLVQRKSALAAAAKLESVEGARERHARGAPPPPAYVAFSEREPAED